MNKEKIYKFLFQSTPALIWVIGWLGKINWLVYFGIGMGIGMTFYSIYILIKTRKKLKQITEFGFHENYESNLLTIHFDTKENMDKFVKVLKDGDNYARKEDAVKQAP